MLLGRSSPIVFAAVLAVTSVANRWAPARQDTCQVVEDANAKSTHRNMQYHNKTTGADVFMDIARIHQMSDTQTCKYLRDEAVSGDPTSVYSRHEEAKQGTTDELIWISKSSGLLVKEELDATVPAKGKGHVSVTFTYDQK